MEKREDAPVPSRKSLDTDGLDEDVHELSVTKMMGRWRCTDESMMSSKCAETVNWGNRTGQQVLADVKASNAHTKNIMWKHSDFLRHAASEKREEEPLHSHKFVGTASCSQ